MDELVADTKHWASSAAQNVGAFFGVTQTDKSNLNKWKETVEDKIKSGEGGIPLRRATSSSVHNRIIHQTEKAISQLSLGADSEYISSLAPQIADGEVVDETVSADIQEERGKDQKLLQQKPQSRGESAKKKKSKKDKVSEEDEKLAMPGMSSTKSEKTESKQKSIKFDEDKHGKGEVEDLSHEHQAVVIEEKKSSKKKKKSVGDKILKRDKDEKVEELTQGPPGHMVGEQKYPEMMTKSAGSKTLKEVKIPGVDIEDVIAGESNFREALDAEEEVRVSKERRESFHETGQRMKIGKNKVRNGNSVLASPDKVNKEGYDMKDMAVEEKKSGFNFKKALEAVDESPAPLKKTTDVKKIVEDRIAEDKGVADDVAAIKVMDSAEKHRKKKMNDEYDIELGQVEQEVLLLEESAAKMRGKSVDVKDKSPKSDKGKHSEDGLKEKREYVEMGPIDQSMFVTEIEKDEVPKKRRKSIDMKEKALKSDHVKSAKEKVESSDRQEEGRDGQVIPGLTLEEKEEESPRKRRRESLDKLPMPVRMLREEADTDEENMAEEETMQKKWRKVVAGKERSPRSDKGRSHVDVIQVESREDNKESKGIDNLEKTAAAFAIEKDHSSKEKRKKVKKAIDETDRIVEEKSVADYVVAAKVLDSSKIRKKKQVKEQGEIEVGQVEEVKEPDLEEMTKSDKSIADYVIAAKMMDSAKKRRKKKVVIDEGRTELIGQVKEVKEPELEKMTKPEKSVADYVIAAKVLDSAKKRRKKKMNDEGELEVGQVGEVREPDVEKATKSEKSVADYVVAAKVLDSAKKHRKKKKVKAEGETKVGQVEEVVSSDVEEMSKSAKSVADYVVAAKLLNSAKKHRKKNNLKNQEMGQMEEVEQLDIGKMAEPNIEYATEGKEFMKELAYGQEAYKHYSFFAELERKMRIEELKEQKEEMIEHFQYKIAMVDEVVELAQAYYNNPKGKESEEWNELKNQIRLQGDTGPKSKTVIRTQLSTLQNFKPIFTVFIILAQVACIGLLCGLGGITRIGLEPRLELLEGIKTFIGTETVDKWLPPNLWIGPSQKHLIALGAVYAPCMREDFVIQMDIMKKNYSLSKVLGCCEMEQRNTAGTTTVEECHKLTNGVGLWKEGMPCGARPDGENYVAHNLMPCCTDLKGTCELRSFKHCAFLGGIFHPGAEHCNQINCLADVCRFGGLQAKPWHPWLPAAPNQWYRWMIGLVYHQGIIHTILVIGAEYLLMRQLEVTAGWFRMLAIYVLSGLGGLVAAAVFSPYQAHAGGTGSVFGMIGVILVELIQFWRIVNKPWLEVTKISVALAIFLFSGTLPYLNNFSIITGLAIGVLCAFIFLPYVTFGKWHTKCRIILIATAVPLLFLIYFFLFYMFFAVQMLDICVGCTLFNCIPYTDKMCKSEYWHW